MITDHTGAIVQEQSFDAWGLRRNAVDWQVLSSSILTASFGVFSDPITTRGFTGYEMVDEVGIIDMNGRIYDPKLGRFLQADPLVQEPFNTQSLNRYSYGFNNPLKYTDPSGYISLGDFRISKHIIRGVAKILGPEVSNALVQVGSLFCGPWAPACAAVGTYDVNRAFGASPGDARKAGVMAGVSQWAFAPSGGAPTWGQAGMQLTLNTIAAHNPELGQALMFVNGYWDDPSVWAQEAVGATMQYHASRKIAEEAARHGLTIQEFNLILALNSKVGLAIAGSTFDGNTGTGTIEGFMSRSIHPNLGVIWDVNDTLLNAQGLLDAVSLQVVRSGHSGPMKGHSLGAARVNNLHRQGFISSAKTLSLPFFTYPSAGSSSYCGVADGICGGALLNMVRPATQSVGSPSSWDVFNKNHKIDTVPGYRKEWYGP